MPGSSINYGLILYDAVGDVGENFLDYRDDIAGTGTSNMVKIDAQMKVNETSASDNASEIDTIKGVGWTTESIKGNADDIDSIEADIVDNIKTHIRYFDSTGTNTYAVDTTGDFDFLDGNILYVNFTNSNTGASTVSIDGTSAREVIWEDTLEDVESGVLNGYLKLVYNLSEDKLMVERQAPSFAQLQEFRSIMGSPLNAVGGPISDNGGNALTLTGLTLQNSVVNGDFSDGTTGWLANSVSQSVSNGINTLTSTVINSGVGITKDALTTDGSSIYLYYLKYKVLDSNVGNVKIRHDSVNQTIDGSPEVGKLKSKVLRLTSSSAGQVGIRFSSSAVGAQIEIHEMMQINLTALNLTGKTDAELLDIYQQGYIDGVQSNESPVVETVGKNLFDKNDTTLGVEFNSTGGSTTPSTTTSISNYCKVQAGVEYTIDNGALEYTIFYDNNKNYLSGLFSTGSDVFTPDFDGFIRFNYSNSAIETVQVRESAKSSDYELHQSDQCQYPVTLGSVPSGAEDKLTHSDAKVIKQKEVETYVLQESDILSINTANTNIDIVILSDAPFTNGSRTNWDNSGVAQNDMLWHTYKNGVVVDATSSIGVVYTSSNSPRLQVAKGEYASLAEAQADLAGTKIVYELATPTTEPVPTSAELTIFKDGYIYNTSDTFFGELDIQCPTNISAVQKGYEYGVRANSVDIDFKKSYEILNESNSAELLGSGYCPSTTSARILVPIKGFTNLPTVTIKDLGSGIIRLATNGTFVDVSGDDFVVERICDEYITLTILLNTGTVTQYQAVSVFFTKYSVKFES